MYFAFESVSKASAGSRTNGHCTVWKMIDARHILSRMQHVESLWRSAEDSDSATSSQRSSGKGTWKRASQWGLYREVPHEHHCSAALRIYKEYHE